MCNCRIVLVQPIQQSKGVDLQRYFGLQLQKIEAIRGHGAGLAICLVLWRNLISVRVIHRDGLGQEKELRHIIQ